MQQARYLNQSAKLNDNIMLQYPKKKTKKQLGIRIVNHNGPRRDDSAGSGFFVTSIFTLN